MGLKNKLLLLALLPLTLLLFSLMTSTYYIESSNLEDDFKSFKTKLLESKKNLLKTEVEIATKIVNYQLSLGEQGNVNEALRGVTFSSSGYFFIYDTDGINIFHGLKPEIEGKNKIDTTDPNGKKLIVGLIEQAKQGGGFFNYHYQKPNVSELVEKMSYATLVPNTNWMIGTGAYLDDIENELTSYHQTMIQHMQDKAVTILLIALFWFLLTVFAVLYVAGFIVKPIANMLENLQSIAKGEGDLTKRLHIDGSDEISQLGIAFNEFIEKLQGIIKNVADVTQDVKSASDEINQQTQLMEGQLGHHNNETELVVTAITEMSATSSEVAMNTTQVAESTQSATEDVAKAQDCVDISLTEVSNLMTEINTGGRANKLT